MIWDNSQSATRLPTCPAPLCLSPSAASTGRSKSTSTLIKLQAHQLSLMDVVRTVNGANTILPGR